jgi:hypothetical protein
MVGDCSFHPLGGGSKVLLVRVRVMTNPTINKDKKDNMDSIDEGGHGHSTM